VVNTGVLTGVVSFADDVSKVGSPVEYPVRNYARRLAAALYAKRTSSNLMLVR
jgi:hypothetical protein